MKYIFSKNTEQKHSIAVEVIIENCSDSSLELQLPAWRPGRYELQNFAKNLHYFYVEDVNGNRLPSKKIAKDRWRVETENSTTLHCKYSYVAYEKNAGSSFIDDEMFYCNPVNCCIYTEKRMNEPCEIEIKTSEQRPIACGLPFVFQENSYHATATDFHHLADSPWLISRQLQHKTYEVKDVLFHIWVAGNVEMQWERVLSDFKKFTKEQLNVFGNFPEKDYHFLLWVLPFPYYHGVEHRNSTMMVLGPNSQPFEEMYVDLLGLASHELFHAWNICKIRPEELLPYDYSKENYFETCFIAEGITTFYGDWMLHRAGIFSDEAYQTELETCYRRHFENADNAHQSLLESSYDLWLDGYTVGVPNRKVSVYHKGAIATQLLNDLIEAKFDGKKNLDTVLKQLWQTFGNQERGYSYADYQQICEEIYEGSLREYFALCIEGTESLWEKANQMLAKKGLKLTINDEQNVILTTSNSLKIKE
jgi:predicted metalloprotease with PDZ domain